MYLNIIRNPEYHKTCDGKTCGMGKYAGGGSYLCPHNNLKALFPHIATQWDNERNKQLPEEFLPKSNKKIWWKCNNNICGCHIWEASISNRTRDDSGNCPFCTVSRPCPHNNIKVSYPDLIEEWDYGRNKTSPTEYSSGSNSKVWWKCRRSQCECHKWQASINHRIQGSGCPYCNCGKVCDHYNLSTEYPEIAIEWHHELNHKSANNYSPHARDVVWWKCSLNKCGCHIWQSSIYDRTGTRLTVCPFCNKGRPCKHNNLSISDPDLAKEWDYELNQKPPTAYMKSSNAKVYWICLKSRCKCHKWKSSISNRSSGRGCPYCVSQAICAHNNFAILYPELLQEWDYDNNEVDPTKVSPHTGLICQWKCDKHHKWKTSVNHRTQGTQCPQCSTSKGYSRKQIEWIINMMDKENINIQHAECESGEYYIPCIGKVDGFCRENNTVYEFHGDFWHGNPLLFDPNDINAVNKKLFGDLYRQTIERDNKIRSLGYNLIVKWETELINF